MRRYLQILRTPHVARLFAASLLARLPIGINGLAIVLLLRAETGSFSVAGATAGAFALDSVLTETIFTVAPLLTALLVVLLDPAAALLVSAATVLVGSVALV